MKVNQSAAVAAGAITAIGANVIRIPAHVSTHACGDKRISPVM